MRIAILTKSDVPVNAQYRGLMLVNVLRERGHEVAWWGSEKNVLPFHVFAACDLIHLYRVVPVRLLRLFRRLQAQGVALTYDNDDDITALDERAPNYAEIGGAYAVRDFAIQKQIILQADAVTTTSQAIADNFRRAGAEHVAAIENYLPREFVKTRRRRHRGVVIGWVAAGEHVVDAHELGLVDTFLTVLRSVPNVRIATLGAAPLALEHERYEHRPYVPFDKLVSSMAEFDIGLAPLADIPFNRARSNVKAKEYAAAGVPWLASPVGEYASLGPEQGGRLVADDEWVDALRWLATHPIQRAIQGRRAKRWAKSQTLQVNAERWEETFEAAIERACRRRATARPHARRRRAARRKVTARHHVR